MNIEIYYNYYIILLAWIKKLLLGILNPTRILLIYNWNYLKIEEN